MTEYQQALVEAMRRELGPYVEIEFDEDGEHVYVALPHEGHTRRYRLGEDTRRFLAGEFPLGTALSDHWPVAELKAPEPGPDYIQRFPTNDNRR